MPELPEVEVTRQGLLPHLSGQRIIDLHASHFPLRHRPSVDELRKSLIGATIDTVDRRAKYLLLPLDNGEMLIFHLGMTGRLGLFPQDTPSARHDHIVLCLENGLELRFNDTRRFGAVYLLNTEERERREEIFFSATGPEPLGPLCTARYLHGRAANCHQAVKTFIMNASVIAGVGNIYANESLFDASIHPETPAAALSLKEWQRLLASIQRILHWAIECGGSTISDFLGASGESGYFQANFKVYNQARNLCPQCDRVEITRKVVNGRATFFCPRCQRRKRAGRRTSKTGKA